MSEKYMEGMFVQLGWGIAYILNKEIICNKAKIDLKKGTPFKLDDIEK